MSTTEIEIENADLLIATKNSGKVRELRQMLADLPIALRTIDELGLSLDVDETGQTFEENAIIKGQAYARASSLMTIADDSGLEVDALRGEPGVKTARYGGKDLSPAERYELLLQEMQDIPWEKRTARFRCAIALASPNGVISIAEGKCDGIIAFEPSGTRGFGYDPIFFLPDLDRTMAQLTPSEKEKVSHRGKAIRALRANLLALLASGN